MLKRPREYHRPTTLASALELLRQPNTAPLVLGPRVPDNLYAGAEAVVDLSRLDLNYIRQDTDGVIRIGGLTPLSALADSVLIRSYVGGVLAEAAHIVAASGLRDVATVAGAWRFQEEGPPEVKLALGALQAIAVLEGDSPTELLREVRLPPMIAGTGGALERLARTPRDEAIVAAVVVVNPATPQVWVGLGPAPVYSVSAKPDDILQAVNDWQPASDLRATAEYRQAMAGVLTRRALKTARGRSTENH